MSALTPTPEVTRRYRQGRASVPHAAVYCSRVCLMAGGSNGAQRRGCLAGAVIRSATEMKRPPTEAALLRRVTELRYLAVLLPEFGVMTINKFLGVLFRSLIIGAHKLNRPDEMAVSADNVHPITSHLHYSAGGPSARRCPSPGSRSTARSLTASISAGYSASTASLLQSNREQRRSYRPKLVTAGIGKAAYRGG